MRGRVRAGSRLAAPARCLTVDKPLSSRAVAKAHSLSLPPAVADTALLTQSKGPAAAHPHAGTDTHLPCCSGPAPLMPAGLAFFPRGALCALCSAASARRRFADFGAGGPAAGAGSALTLLGLARPAKPLCSLSAEEQHASGATAAAHERGGVCFGGNPISWCTAPWPGPKGPSKQRTPKGPST
jgi:hypothetical protein